MLLPCGKEDVSQQFVDAVCGLLSGEYRLVEYWRRGKAVKAELQRPIGDEWQKVAGWARLHIPVRWGMTTKALQNLPSA